MPSRSQIHYFGAGPAPLPTSVLEAASIELLNHHPHTSDPTQDDDDGMGIGIAELSHRSAEALAVITSAKESLYTLLSIEPAEYDILFLQGGGSGQFSAVVYHMIGLWVEEVRQGLEAYWTRASAAEAPTTEDEKFAELQRVVKQYLRCDYIVTGSWSLKASQEASRLLGSEHVNVAVDSRQHNDGKFGTIPDESTWVLTTSKSSTHNNIQKKEAYIPRQPAFTYYCDNETVDGVEFPSLPSILTSSSSTDESQDPHIVCDMSSNFLSRRIPVSKYSIIFAGAQKNLGLAGLTLSIIRRSLLPPTKTLASPTLLRKLGLPVGPIVFDFPTVAKNGSLYNTLPIFDVWIAAKVLAGLREMHGDKLIHGQETLAGEKAEKIYQVLDSHPEVYTVVPDKKARSRMNICVRIKGGDEGEEKRFIREAEKRGLLGLKGHRSVGGLRISNYNAVTMEAVDKLVVFLQSFAREKREVGH